MSYLPYHIKQFIFIYFNFFFIIIVLNIKDYLFSEKKIIVTKYLFKNMLMEGKIFD